MFNWRVRKDLKENLMKIREQALKEPSGRLKYKVPKAEPTVPGVLEDYQSS